MANDLTQDPLVIDTAGAGAVVPAPARVYGIKMMAAAAGACQVKDAVSGHIVWEANLAATTTTPLDILKMEVKGGIAVTLLSGAGNKVYIYLGPPR